MSKKSSRFHLKVFFSESKLQFRLKIQKFYIEYKFSVVLCVYFMTLPHFVSIEGKEGKEDDFGEDGHFMKMFYLIFYWLMLVDFVHILAESKNWCR